MIDKNNVDVFMPSQVSKEESARHFANTYYIKYNAKKGLHAISQLHILANEEPHDVFLCHIYIEMLLQALGMLYDRFNSVDVKYSSVNKKDYGFDKSVYPLISNKRIRNYCAHIDERDDKSIEAGKFHGTFSVIFPKMDSNLREKLLNKKHSNVLNLETMEYYIIDSKHGYEASTINLNDLETELMSLYKIASSKWDIISLGFF